MKRYLRLAGFIILALLILIAVVFGTAWLYQDELIDKLKNEVNCQLNADVDFESYQVKLFRNFPDATFGIQGLSLSGRNAFDKDTLLNVADLEVEVDLWSLIKRPFVIESFGINRGVIKAKVLEDGRVNWDIFPKGNKIENEEHSDSLGEGIQYHVQQILFTESTLLYEDNESNIRSSLDNVLIDLSRVKDQKYWKSRIDIPVWNTRYGAMHLMKNVKAHLEADLILDADQYGIEFGQNKLQLNEMEFELDGSASMPDSSIFIDMAFRSTTTSFKNLLSLLPSIYTTQFANLETEGNYDFSGLIAGTYDADHFPETDLRLQVQKGALKYPDLPDNLSDVSMDLLIHNSGGEVDGTVIDLTTFKAKLGEDPVDISFLLKEPESNPFIQLNARANLELSKWKDFFPLKNTQELQGGVSTSLKLKGRIADFRDKHYEKVEASGILKGREIKYLGELFSKKLSIDVIDLELNPQKIAIKNSKANIGQSDIEIKGNIEAFIPWLFDEGKMLADLNLYSDVLNIDEILEQEENEKNSGGDLDTTKIPGGFEIPTSLTAILQVEIANMRFNDMDMENVIGRVDVREGRASFSNVNVDMLGGNVVFNGTYFSDSLSIDPFVDMDVKLHNVNLSQTVSTFNTVQKLAPIAQRCYGDYSANLKLKGNLKEGFSPDLSTLAGFLKFKAEKLQVEQIDVMKQVGQFTGSKYFDSPTLSKVNAHLEINDGNIEVKPFKTFIKEAIVTIGGKQGLNNSLDYYMQFDVPSNVLNSEKNEIAKILFGKIPVPGNTFEWPERIHFDALIGGTLKDPNLKLNVKDGLKSIGEEIIDQAKSKAEEEIEKARAALIQQAEKKASELISLAEKQGDKLIVEAQKKADDLKKSANQQIDRLHLESAKKADELVAKAGDNPLKKLAAQQAAKLLKDEAKEQAEELKKEATKQADKLVTQAKGQKENLITAAKTEGDKLIEEARTKPLSL